MCWNVRPLEWVWIGVGANTFSGPQVPVEHAERQQVDEGDIILARPSPNGAHLMGLFDAADMNDWRPADLVHRACVGR